MVHQFGNVGQYWSHENDYSSLIRVDNNVRDLFPSSQVVYREWTCAMLVPVYGPTAADAGRRKTADGGSPAQAAAAAAATAAPPTAAAAEGSLAQPPPPPPAPSPMKPCREFCHRVEEQCPYFHPAAREQYAGEPVFICIEKWSSRARQREKRAARYGRSTERSHANKFNARSYK
ncbi:hypothetical protein HPB52_017287 [Rhipicephalus sanguineus]|uniref:Uncharacterized protein n=1 Tax=Rhipicephalus sanguineus TaxID=34632 RepID=A0A9D4T101_RHISA|nr:hypothetical protein HPB52_017287 [Rhipicephalus sanguineus]